MSIDSCFFLFDPKSLTAIALDALEAEGLQVPSHQHLAVIIDSARRASHLLGAASALAPDERDLLEFFADFIVPCANRPAGVGDAASV